MQFANGGENCLVKSFHVPVHNTFYRGNSTIHACLVHISQALYYAPKLFIYFQFHYVFYKVTQYFSMLYYVSLR